MIDATPVSPRIVSQAAAARILNVSRRKLERQIRSGILSTVRHNGRIYVQLPAGAPSHAVAHNPVWTREKIVRALRSLARNGEPLTRGNVEQAHPGLFSAACAPGCFGSWQATLAAADVDASYLQV